MAKQKICLVGSGNIAAIHAEIISNSDVLDLYSIFDVNQEAANKFKNKYPSLISYDSWEALTEDDKIDCFHVLTPPDTHFEIFKKLLFTKKKIFVEKPLYVCPDKMGDLIKSSISCEQYLYTNHNAIYYPAFLKLLDASKQNTVGPITHVECTYNVVLRQLSAKQFGHWMFSELVNIFLEQAVHPLSQVRLLIGEFQDLSIQFPDYQVLNQEKKFAKKVVILIKGARATATVYFDLSSSYTSWVMKGLCSDGILIADVLNNFSIVERKFKWVSFLSDFVSGLSLSGQYLSQSLMNIGAYFASLFKLRGRSDVFYRSMQKSISEYYANTHLGANLDFAQEIINACFEIEKSLLSKSYGDQGLKSKSGKKNTANDTKTLRETDVLLIGGTGFIGKACVKVLLKDKYTVSILARNVNNLPDIFHDESVQLIKGDYRHLETLENAICHSKHVINLAHGGGGDSWQAIYSAMYKPVEHISSLCLKYHVKRFIHIGSIASLYLGDQEIIKADLDSDKQSDRRGEYSRAKAMVDEYLIQQFREKKLAVVVLRPGVVVGSDGVYFHSGLGTFNNDMNCLGWNQGDNPLPFILVDDVAVAIAQALKSKNIEGHTFNIVSTLDVSASEYIEHLSNYLGRPIKFWPQSPKMIYLEDCVKYAVKKIIRKDTPKPSYRDILSRGMVANFDISAEKELLDWTPCEDKTLFFQKLFPASDLSEKQL